jgi:PAS domain S-box-containing protein
MKDTLRDVLDHVPVFVCRPGGEILHWTNGCEELFGYTEEEAQGRLSHELLRTVFPDDLAAIETKVGAEKKWTGRLRHVTKDERVIWVLAVWRSRQGVEPAGPIIVKQNTDITSQVELEEQKNILARELEHRVKNLLAVVQSLARTSFRDAPEEQRRKFENRLVALAEANRLLREESWEQADLYDLVMEVARAIGVDRRVAPYGPKVTIGSQNATGVALAVHELCTNALKHGALSVPEGRVEVSWRMTADGEHVALRWEEVGGPEPSPPSKFGFGMRLIEQAVAGQLGSPVKVRFEPTGVVCEMQIPATGRA